MGNDLIIIGQGAFGSALAALYREAGLDVAAFGRDHPRDLDAPVVLLAVPTAALGEVLGRARFADGCVPVLCCKGMLENGGVPSTLLGTRVFGVLSGPGFADEVSAGLPTIHSVAAVEDALAERLARVLSTPRFRLYWTSDVIGVQVCGAMKNILAIAAGIVTQLGLGENARASLLVRGMSELGRAVEGFGGRAETVMAPAGIGDVFLTCASEKSRNFRFGQRIAAGEQAQDALAALGTVEGLHALRGLLRAVPGEDAPIAQALWAVIHDGLAPEAAVETLMQRPVRAG